MKLKTYIVDDEPLTIASLIRHIDKTPQIELLGHETDPATALYFLQSNTVDFIFLDISMQPISGLEFVKQTNIKTVFTTAYRQYADEALYNPNVVDFLVKPITFERYNVAIQKIMDLFSFKKPEIRRNIFIKTLTGTTTLYLDDVLYIKANGAYSEVHLISGELMIPAMLSEAVSLFPSDIFIRIHKSYIANKTKVIKRTYKIVILVNNEALPVGRMFQDAFG